jgi:hypothetical protein
MARTHYVPSDISEIVDAGRYVAGVLLPLAVFRDARPS